MKINLKTGTLNIKDAQNIDTLEQLIGFSSRINKKRGFLFVSKVLGKHIPCKPSKMKEVHKKLADILKEKINDKPTVFIGFAETATGIGNGVYEEFILNNENSKFYKSSQNSFYIHTSRYNLSNERLLEFKEEHCHAPSHILYKPTDLKLNEIFDNAENIVLVDDEISTGKTLNNIIEVLKNNFPQVKKYYSVSIINWCQNFNPEIDYIYLYNGSFDFKYNDFQETQNIVSEAQDNKFLNDLIPYNFGRFGIQDLQTDYEKIIDIDDIKDKKVLVLGTGEFMFQAFKLAEYLENKNIDVYVQSTTRSPVNIDMDIKSKLNFKDNYGENIDNFLYNVIDKDYDLIIICYETEFIPTEHNLKEILGQKYNISNIKEIFFKN